MRKTFLTVSLRLISLDKASFEARMKELTVVGLLVTTKDIANSAYFRLGTKNSTFTHDSPSCGSLLYTSFTDDFNSTLELSVNQGGRYFMVL